MSWDSVDDEFADAVGEIWAPLRELHGFSGPEFGVSGWTSYPTALFRKGGIEIRLMCDTRDESVDCYVRDITLLDSHSYDINKPNGWTHLIRWLLENRKKVLAHGTHKLGLGHTASQEIRHAVEWHFRNLTESAQELLR